MDGHVRRKLAAGSRVKEFSLANPSTEPGHQAVVTKIQELLARADQLGSQQSASQNEERAASTRRLKSRDQIEFGLLGPLAKVGRQASKEAPELLGKFRSTRVSATHKAFLINARNMLAEAVAHKDLLVSQGLASTLPDDLDKALARFEAETDTINLSLRGHIGARAELVQLAADLGDLIEVLDGFNRYRYQDEPEQLAAWNAAKSVVGHSPRKSTTPPSSTDSGSPSAPTGGDTRAA